LRPDFEWWSSIHSFKNPRHPPKALGQHDVGHSVVATGRDVLRLGSFQSWLDRNYIRIHLTTSKEVVFTNEDSHY